MHVAPRDLYDLSDLEIATLFDIFEESRSE
nr:MAG TPA: hypothetical protein [Caudoviricetes sp.]